MVGVDTRLFVVGYPTAEADTVRVCLDRWTLAEWGEKVEFCERSFPRDFSHLFSYSSSSGQIWVRRRLWVGWNDQMENRVAVKAERRGMTGSQLTTGCSWRVEAEGATFERDPMLAMASLLDASIDQ